MSKMKSPKVFTIITAIYAVLLNLFNLLIETPPDINNSVSSFVSIIPTLTGIFTCIFVGSDYKNGYMKNIASIVQNKAKIIFSKSVNIILFSVYLAIVHIIVHIISSLIFFGNDYKINCFEFVNTVSFLAFEFFIIFAINMIIVTTVSVTRSNALGYVATIAIYTNTIYLFGSIAELVLKSKEILPESFNLADYLLSPYVASDKFDTEFELIYKGIIVAVITVIVSLILSINAINKKDIK